MMPLYLFLFLSATFVFAQNTQRQKQNLPSITREEGNLDDAIAEIFNLCKCVIFYQCDEKNFIIPEEELPYTRTTLNKSLRSIDRIRCSNDFYYCCKNRNDAFTASTTSTVIPSYMPSIPRPYPKVCGIQNSPAGRIIDQFPWTVAVYKKRESNNTYIFKCGGSLIHPRVVMTQRKCVRLATTNELAVVSGAEFLSSQNIKLAVSKTIEHELYYSGGMYNDIALIILRTPLTSVTPVCLPKSNQNFDGKRCTAVGWGGRDRYGTSLRMVDLPIVGRQSCQKLLRNNTSLSPDFEIHSSVLCAGGEEGKDTCKDDGGGPLMCEENGRYIQVGIVSWGLACGKKDVPSLYTNVANLVPWIQQKLIDENL